MIALVWVETMLDYGMMNDWDEAVRACESEQRRKTQIVPKNF
ncbi:MAG: hypothetical protein QMC80_03085 [Thermoplasmatales archaeon]|nr:hypothetical protein [Thermoplasmatales archaeon]